MLHSVMLVRLRKMGRGVKSNISVLIAITITVYGVIRITYTD